jgi:hypothetical protein
MGMKNKRRIQKREPTASVCVHCESYTGGVYRRSTAMHTSEDKLNSFSYTLSMW